MLRSVTCILGPPSSKEIFGRWNIQDKVKIITSLDKKQLLLKSGQGKKRFLPCTILKLQNIFVPLTNRERLIQYPFSGFFAKFVLVLRLLFNLDLLGEVSLAIWRYRIVHQDGLPWGLGEGTRYVEGRLGALAPSFDGVITGLRYLCSSLASSKEPTFYSKSQSSRKSHALGSSSQLCGRIC